MVESHTTLLTLRGQPTGQLIATPRKNTVIESRSSDGFSYEEGAPKSKEEWDALSREEKQIWEQRRRRRKFIRRHGHRAKGLAQLVNPQHRPTLGLRGRGHLRRKRKIDRPIQHPTPEQLADKPGLEPTREIPDSGRRGPSGNLHSMDLRMIRRASRERWKLTDEMTQDIPASLVQIIEATADSNPVIAIQATNALSKLMAQNQADEHEEIKRSSLTKEQASELVRVLVETVQTEVDDAAVRQRIASKLGMALMAMGVINTSLKPAAAYIDTPAAPRYEST